MVNVKRSSSLTARIDLRGAELSAARLRAAFSDRCTAGC
jgi:hypothetical protein